MSMVAVAWARKRKLPAYEKLVLLTLADRANADHEVWPKQRTLAEDCGMARETATRVLQKLEERGLLVAMRRAGSARAGLSYVLAIPPEEEGDGVAEIALTLFAAECGGETRLGLTRDVEATIGQMRESNRERVSLWIEREGPAGEAKAALARLRERFDNARGDNGWLRVAKADLVAALADIWPETAAGDCAQAARSAPARDNPVVTEDHNGTCETAPSDVTITHNGDAGRCDDKSHPVVTINHNAIVETKLEPKSPLTPLGPCGGGSEPADGPPGMDHPGVAGEAGGKGEARAESADPPRLAEQFDALGRAYGLTVAMDRQAALREFGLMTAAERVAAIAGARAYAEACAAERRKKLDLDLWLRKRRWIDLSALRTTAEGRAQTRIFVIAGSDAWRAWLAHRRARSFPTTSRGGREGWFFPSLFPPTEKSP